MNQFLTWVLTCALFFWGCQKKTTPAAEKKKLDLRAKKVAFQNLPPNVTSMQWEYNKGSFALKQISSKRGVLSQLKETDNMNDVLVGDAKLFKYIVFSNATMLYTGFVKIPVSMHTFYYRPDRIPHEKSKMNESFFNVNIPLDSTKLITRIIFSEVVIRDGKFSTVIDSLGTPKLINQEIIINQPKQQIR